MAIRTYEPRGNDVEKKECARCGGEYRKSALAKQKGILVCPECWDKRFANPLATTETFEDIPGVVFP